MLGIEMGEYGYRAEGPCVIVARDVKATAEAYDHLSHGGDLSASCEVVPESSQADPSWRYLLFQRSFEGTLNIMMFRRGSKAADHPSDEYFINFEGLRNVSDKLPGSLRHQCSREFEPACESPRDAELRATAGETLESASPM